jgi:hypothetical protein
MKRLIFLTFISTFFILNTSAQTALPARCYMQLSGSINKEIWLTMHLVKVDDSLYGDYNCIVTGKDKNIDYGYDAGSRQFFGKINPQGKLWIKEWPGDKGPIFKGQFKDNQHVAGTWERNENNGKKIPFELVEKKPGGSIHFNTFMIHDHKKLIKDPKSPQANIKMVLLAPLKENDSTCTDSLKKIIFINFSDIDTSYVNPEILLSDIRKDYFDNYIQDNETLYKEMPGASFEWELLRYTHVIFNENYMVTFYILSYSFTGGAHGQETQMFTTMDVKTGKILTLGDLFKTGFETDLSKLLSKKLQRMAGLPESGKLSEAGYFVDEIRPSANFYLNGNGIGFFYNQYEIAPYSFGSTDIFLTKEELKTLLKSP